MAPSRRDFLKTGALVGAGLVMFPHVFAGTEPARAPAGPSGEIAVALIGCGAQGNVLLDALMRLNRSFGVRLVAVCDIWKFKLDATVRRLRANGREVNGYVDFREMLERERSLDAVFVATPDFCHAPQTLACLAAGKHVYCEKMMAENVEGARAIVRAARAARERGLLTQIGHQRRSNPYYRYAFEKILPSGMLGRITHGIGQWNRAVSRDVVAPKKFRPDAALLREFGYEDERQFLNWRWFKKYSGGPVSDLGAHQIDIFNWFLGDPESVIAAGGNDYYANHEWYDNVTATFAYATPAGKVRVTYQTLTTTSYGGGYFEAFAGDEGSLRLSEKPSLVRVYQEPRSAVDWREFVAGGLLENRAVPAEFAAAADEDGVEDARASASAPADEFVFPRGVALGAKTIHQPHVENFVRAIRGKARLTCDAEEAFRAEAPIYRVNEAVAAEKMLRYSPEDFAV